MAANRAGAYCPRCENLTIFDRDGKNYCNICLQRYEYGEIGIIERGKQDFLINASRFVMGDSTGDEKKSLSGNTIDIIKKTLLAVTDSFDCKFNHLAAPVLTDAVVFAVLKVKEISFANFEEHAHKILVELGLSDKEDVWHKYVIYKTIIFLEKDCNVEINEYTRRLSNVKNSDNIIHSNEMELGIYWIWFDMNETNNIIYFKKFAEKFIDKEINEDEILKFHDFIEHKQGEGVKIDYIAPIVKELQLTIKRDKLIQKANERNAQSLKDYCKIHLETYGENYIENIRVLEEAIIFKKMQYKGRIEDSMEEYKKDIEMKRYDKWLGESIESKSYSVQTIDKMNGFQFEMFLKVLFEKMGYNVELTKRSGDQGADLVLVKFGKKTVVQAKQYSKKVSNTAVQEITAAINHYSAQVGMVVTSNEFTPGAIELAHSCGIRLVNRTKLSEWIKEYL